MGILAKNLQYKNLTAGLSAIRRNGRYKSMIHITAANSQDENNGVIEKSTENATESSANKTQPLNLLPLKASVSNLKNNPIFWPISNANTPAKEKFPLHLLNKSLSTSSIVWSKKSRSDANVSKNVNPNYDYPYLSKIFGTENLLMRSDAYNQALIEAAKRRAALEECNNVSKEVKTDEFKRAQVMNIKGWGASKTNIKPALESKPQTSNSSLTTKGNLKQVNKSNTKSDSRQSSDVWNADKTNSIYGMKYNIKAYKPCPPPVKPQKQGKDDPFKSSDHLNASNPETELRSSKPFLSFEKPLKPADAGTKICDPNKLTDFWNVSKAGVQHELKRKSHSSNNCPPPAKLKKQADGSCKKDDPCKPQDPCKPSDPCKEELEKLQKRKEEERKRNRNKMPTGCVDPKCNQNDKCNKTPKTPSKKASSRRRSQRRTLTAVRRLRGCISKGDEKPICKDNKQCDVQKIVGFDRKKRPYSPSENLFDKNNPSGADKQKEFLCSKGQNTDTCGSKDPRGSSKKIDDPCGSKKKDPCQDKKPNPCDSRKKDSISPCGDRKNESTKDGPCGSKTKDTSQDKKPNPCDTRKKDSTSPCGDRKKESTKDDPCGSKTKDTSQDKKPNPCDIRKKDSINPCGDRKKEPTKYDPCGSKTKDTSQVKKPNPCDSRKKDSISPCGDRKKESTKDDPCGSKRKDTSQDKKPNPCDSRAKDPCEINTKKETPNKKKDPCGSNKQIEDPSKKKDPSGSNKQNEKSNDCIEKGPCHDKKPTPPPSRADDPDRIPCRTCTSVEKKEPTSPHQPKLTAKRDCGRPITLACSNIKTSSSTCGSLKEEQRRDSCKASSSAKEKECTSPSLLKTIVKRDCGRPIKHGLSVNKISSKSCGSLTEKEKPCTGPSLTKTIAKRDCGRPISNIKISSKSCENLKTEQRKDPCKSNSSIEKKESTNQDCGVQKRSTKPNCPNAKQSLSNCGSAKKEQSAETKVPISPCLTKTSTKRDCGKPISDSKSDCSNLKQSVSTCDSLKENKKGDSCKSEGKPPASPNALKTAGSLDCGRPKRETKPNCSNRKEPSMKAIKYPCKPKASSETIKNPTQSASKTAANLNCGKQKKDTKPNGSKSFSTLTINTNENLSRMIRRTISTLPSIRNSMFMRNFSSKSRDKNKKDSGDFGKKSQCKSVGTTVPTKRKPIYNPHPNENLRQCYPTYDMDCRKLCKDARKTDCKKYAFLEETNTNKRKGHK